MERVYSYNLEPAQGIKMEREQLEQQEMHPARKKDWALVDQWSQSDWSMMQMMIWNQFWLSHSQYRYVLLLQIPEWFDTVVPADPGRPEIVAVKW